MSKTDVDAVAGKLLELVAANQFKILFDAMWEHDCPPREFQLERCAEGEGVNPYREEDTCLDCWHNYTRMQALLNLGFIHKIEEETDDG